MIFYKFILNDGRYSRDKFATDHYLSGLKNVFDNGVGWAQSVRDSLLEPLSKGVTGNKAEIDIIGDIVKIYPQFVDNPEEFEIEIDRDVLLGLINKWLELVEKESSEIYFIRYDDGRIEVRDHLPIK